MKRRLLMIVILFTIALVGCAGRPEITLTITSPADGSVVTLASNTQPDPVSHPFLHWLPGSIDVTVGNLPRNVSSPCDYPATAWEVRDNGRILIGGAGTTYFAPCSDTSPHYSFRWEPSTLGEHILSVRAGVQLDRNSDRITWFETGNTTICVVNDPLNPVPGVPLGTIGHCDFPPTPTITPTFTPTFTVTLRPTFTPVPSIPIPVNPAQQGEGCAQYTDQVSCNRAACSWDGAACIITP